MSAQTVSIFKPIAFVTRESYDNPSFVRIEFTQELLHRIEKIQCLIRDHNLFSVKIEPTESYDFFASGKEEDQIGEKMEWHEDGTTLIIYENAFYFYSQDRKDNSFQIESESITLEEFWGLFEPYEKEETKPESTYVLFGEECCKVFAEEGAEELLRRFEENEVDIHIEVFTSKSDIADILEKANGWGDYSFLTEEEFKILSA